VWFRAQNKLIDSLREHKAALKEEVDNLRFSITANNLNSDIPKTPAVITPKTGLAKKNVDANPLEMPDFSNNERD